MLDVTITEDAIRIGDRFAVTFQRTLRVPDDGRAYPLPPGLGRLPIRPVIGYADRVPRWRGLEGVFIGMYQREALWLGFHAASWKPNAVKVAVGGINAVSGQRDDTLLCADPQNYLVCPDQPWLDGIHTGEGSVRQFVAMPLGLGYTIEASLADSEVTGGIQLTVFEPKPGHFPDQPPVVPEPGPQRTAMPRMAGGAMGLGAGGALQQKIYPDPHGIDVWNQHKYQRVVIHILNAEEFSALTGEAPPPTPIDAETYTHYGLPWFALYDESRSDVKPSQRLATAKTIAERDAERGVKAPPDASVEIPESQINRIEHGK